MLIKLKSKRYPGMFAIINKEDFYKVKEYSWYLIAKSVHNHSSRPYGLNKSGKYVLMHRLITNCPKGKVVDHINHKALDNRKCNLRIATKSQNCWNSKMSKRNKSGYKGVSWYKKYNKWRVCIRKNNIYKHLGYVADLSLAKDMYNNAAIMMFGEFAKLNK